MTKRVLVTGGAGFIGSHVVDRLVERHYHVRVLDNLLTGKLENLKQHQSCGKVEFVKGDVRDKKIVNKSVRDVDAVIHLAALTSVPFSVENPDLTFAVNIGGTMNLLTSGAKQKVDKFVFASSCAVYGEPESLPITENHPTRPISPYASSKLEGERLCEKFNRLSGLRVVVLRLFNVYGPRQALSEYGGVITKFLDCVRSRRSLVVFGDGLRTRDFVYVTDVTEAILASLQSDSAEGVFNIGFGKAVSITDLAKTVLSLSGCDCGINYQPERVGDIGRSLANISKARETFAYSPKVSLEEGLRNLLLEDLGTTR